MMMLLLVLSLVVLFSLGFVITQPMALGLVLLVGSMVSCVIISLEVSSFFGLLLFLTYVSGVMVLFLYVLSIYPNEIYHSQFYFVGVTAMGLLLVVSSMMMDCEVWKVEGKLSLGFMCGKEGLVLYMFMGLALLMVMLVVSYLCMKSHVPLRKVQ